MISMTLDCFIYRKQSFHLRKETITQVVDIWESFFAAACKQAQQFLLYINSWFLANPQGSIIISCFFQVWLCLLTIRFGELFAERNISQYLGAISGISRFHSKQQGDSKYEVPGNGGKTPEILFLKKET